MTELDTDALPAGQSSSSKGIGNAADNSRVYVLVAFVSIVVPILGTGYAAILFFQEGISTVNIALLIGLYIWTILGVELGYHRYMTHRSLKMKPFLKKALIGAGAMAADGPPIWWAAIHRRHHVFTDRVGDPHSPVPNEEQPGGWWYAHIAWMFKPGNTAAQAAVHAKDLLRDQDIVRQVVKSSNKKD